MKLKTTPSCCHDLISRGDNGSGAAKSHLQPVQSLAVAFLVAFFPKCPACWAACMSVFGAFGLAQVHYIVWLLPTLMACLGINLFLLYRNSACTGFGPLILSGAGALAILAGRNGIRPAGALLGTGILLSLTGSLWNSLAQMHFTKQAARQLTPTQ